MKVEQTAQTVGVSERVVAMCLGPDAGGGFDLRKIPRRGPVLVHGASGGLGTLSLQTLSAWGTRVTAIAKESDLSACLQAGAADAIDGKDDPPHA